jgi:Zn-dependent peptidase ImmA (M78 family)
VNKIVFKRGFKSWCENVAILQRKALGLRPIDPLNPTQLAKHLGIEVWSPYDIPEINSECLQILLDEDPDSWSAITVSANSKDVIILNPTHAGGRPASNLMHELAHILIGHNPARIDVSEDGYLMLSTFDRTQEEEAKWLCGCLLLPRDALLLIRRQHISFNTAARRFGVSGLMLQYRLNVTGISKQATYQSKARIPD